MVGIFFQCCAKVFQIHDYTLWNIYSCSLTIGQNLSREAILPNKPLRCQIFPGSQITHFFETSAASTLWLKSRKGLTFSMLLKHWIRSLAWWKFIWISFFAQLKFPSRFLQCILSKTQTRHFNIFLMCFRNSSDLHCIDWLCHRSRTDIT